MRNNSADTRLATTFESDESADITPLASYRKRELHPNESLISGYGKTFASPPTATLLVRWQLDSDPNICEWRKTLKLANRRW